MYRYDDTERALCKLESSALFNEEDKDKLLFSDVSIAPSSSAFLKNRLDIIASSPDYATLIQSIKKEKIANEGFKVEYIVFDGDTTEYPQRLKKLKDIGFSIEGTPDYHHPTTTYALCYHEAVWYFGVLIKNKFAWQKHNQKPCSYSNSISINIAKALVNIAPQGNKDAKLLDACCGVGTILLEAAFAGYTIEGCDINWKICHDARTNLAHFNYKVPVYRSDVRAISKRYDAAILDLPYNLLSDATEQGTLHIIQSAAMRSNRLVIVSIVDISKHINAVGFHITDKCSIRKKGKTGFVRRIWVCEKRID